MPLANKLLLLGSTLVLASCGAAATSKPAPVAETLSAVPVKSTVKTVPPPLTGQARQRAECAARAGIFGPYKVISRQHMFRIRTEAKRGPTVSWEQKKVFDACMEER